MIEKQNDHYLAIENREFDKLVLKSSDNLNDISEGEALLKKILEPYKGKFVLLDIWGTWCGPCKEALSHSTEEYARLKDYDIQYLYLANSSPQTAWENVIKELASPPTSSSTATGNCLTSKLIPSTSKNWHDCCSK